jgi:hypothetical protein
MLLTSAKYFKRFKSVAFFVQLSRDIKLDLFENMYNRLKTPSTISIFVDDSSSVKCSIEL